MYGSVFHKQQNLLKALVNTIGSTHATQTRHARVPVGGGVKCTIATCTRFQSRVSVNARVFAMRNALSRYPQPMMTGGGGWSQVRHSAVFVRTGKRSKRCHAVIGCGFPVSIANLMKLLKYYGTIGS